MKPRLSLFRSLWGCNEHRPFLELCGPSEKFGFLKSLGFDGIEASLDDLGRCRKERQAAVAALREHDLKLITGVYSSWKDYDEHDWRDLHGSIAVQLSCLEAELREVEELGASGVIQHVNVHSGSDAWNEAQCREYFQWALSLGEGRPFSVSHETHRGRPLANPFVCHRLCSEFPDLRLTLDASHWFLVCERLVGRMTEFHEDQGGGDHAMSQEAGVLHFLCTRVDHIHARIGTPESPQLTLIPAAASKKKTSGGKVGAGGISGKATAWEASAVTAHEKLWQSVWRSQVAAGRTVVTATPEYGPAPYTPMAPGTDLPVSDVWEVTNAAVDHLKMLLSSTKFCS